MFGWGGQRRIKGQRKLGRLHTFHYLDCSEDGFTSIYIKLFKCCNVLYVSIKIKLLNIENIVLK